ncbi:MAG: hypothetical protein IRZ20_04390 [Thermoleophilia bacterium]|nr:hypothetical protein [Thermoleophilia bacterium]
MRTLTLALLLAAACAAAPPAFGRSVLLGRSWQNNTPLDTTAFAAELPAGQPDPAAVARYVRAVLAAARAAR